jgi:hypothetical protein
VRVRPDVAERDAVEREPLRPDVARGLEQHAEDLGGGDVAAPLDQRRERRRRPLAERRAEPAQQRGTSLEADDRVRVAGWNMRARAAASVDTSAWASARNGSARVDENAPAMKARKLATPRPSERE